MIDVKILAGYLPYNLQFEGGGDIWTMAGLRTNGDVVLRNGLHTQAIPAEVVGLEYKPMLQKIEELSAEQRNDALKCWITSSTLIEQNTIRKPRG